MNVTLSSDMPKQWEPFVQNHPESTVYHTSSWMQVLGYYSTITPLFAFLTHKGNIQAVMPIARIRNLRGTRYFSLPFSIYGGPLGKDEKSINRLLNDKKIPQNLSIKPSPFENNASWKTQEDIHSSAYFKSSVITLPKTSDTLWSSLSSSKKRNIRKAIKQNVTDSIINNKKDMKFVHNLMLKSRKRHGLPTHELNFYKYMWASLSSQNLISGRIAWNGKQPLAFILNLCHNNKLLYALGGMDIKFQQFRAMDFLFWRSFEGAIENVFDRFDLGPTPVEQENLLFYKQKWGSKQRDYQHYKKGNGAYEDSNQLLLKADKVVCSFFQKSPIILSRSTSPILIRLVS